MLSCTKESRFLDRTITVADHSYRYRVWLPPHYSKVHRWPVVLYLHGADQRGDDNEKQLTAGLPVTLTKSPVLYKAIVVIPQSSEKHEWYGDMETQALAALEQTIREFRGDRRRLYVTGTSIGGSGTWYLARHHRWAAAMPVCGGVSRSDPFPVDPPPDLARIVGAPDPHAAMAEAVGSTPIWIFGNDPSSRAMAAALGNRARYSPGACEQAYGDEGVVKWMMGQRKKR